MSESSVRRWQEGALHALDHCDGAEPTVTAADSWRVSDGLTLALDLHRQRFFEAADGVVDDLGNFWDAAIDAIPRTGSWFPRVEIQRRNGAPVALFRLRPAPDRVRSVRLASHRGRDPRILPRLKGPDTTALLRTRTEAQAIGADEAVILSPAGFVVEGATSAIVWWRGDVLCAPSPELARVDSVTARSVFALATALGTELYFESISPAELDGCEIWALNALHGIRIVTSWIDGPSPAELPGRLAAWRARLARLSRPLPQLGSLGSTA